jgi:hypothetical protein
MEVLELVSRAHERLKAMVGEDWELDSGKLGRLLEVYSPRSKYTLSKVSYAARLLESPERSELILGACHALPFSAICLYILGREAGAPVTILDAAEAVARSVKEGDPGMSMNAHYRVVMGNGLEVRRTKGRIEGPGPLLWYDSGCHKIVLWLQKGDDGEGQVLVLSGHRLSRVVWSLKQLRTLAGIEVKETSAYSKEDLEKRFYNVMTFLRPNLAKTGLRLVAHVGAARFLVRGLRTLGREGLWERAAMYLRYDLGESPAYSAALAATIAIASEPSPELPTYLEIARAFGVSAPSLRRRYERLIKKGLQPK